MTEIAGFAWADFSAGAILAIVVLFIVLGRLVPKSSLDREIQHRDDEIKHWRSAAEKALDQNTKLLDAARSGTQVAAYVQQITEESD